ncbi:NAD(P)-binding protein [Auricularia subglabra TFB-10046 SS5]|uniref:NAD(P)-binding protein n=1 Tax=Auricularia subglabra (strain TFB-10046 / SS5) TaxID=717982 RepID=J0CSY6_AURST|nr:NAD(P)-binding protein [Auricularia subglabra TFB-10046 SS5]
MPMSECLSRLPLNSRPSPRNASSIRAAGCLRTCIVHPRDASQHPWLHERPVIVITCGASSVRKLGGRRDVLRRVHWACASRSPTKNEEELKRTAEELRAICAETDVFAITVDVSSFDAVKAFADKVFQWSDEVNVVLNNAGVGLKSGSWSGLDAWKTMIDVNLMGIVNVQHAFVPHMMPNENPGLFINTGSKQGITNPP